MNDLLIVFDGQQIGILDGYEGKMMDHFSVSTSDSERSGCSMAITPGGEKNSFKYAEVWGEDMESVAMEYANNIKRSLNRRYFDIRNSPHKLWPLDSL